jgi:hypothetical protein
MKEWRRSEGMVSCQLWAMPDVTGWTGVQPNKSLRLTEHMGLCDDDVDLDNMRRGGWVAYGMDNRYSMRIAWGSARDKARLRYLRLSVLTVRSGSLAVINL